LNRSDISPFTQKDLTTFKSCQILFLYRRTLSAEGGFGSFWQSVFARNSSRRATAEREEIVYLSPAFVIWQQAGITGIYPLQGKA